MRKGRNSGKKLLAARIVRSTMEIIHLLTDQNPMQVSMQTYHNCFNTGAITAMV